MANIAFKTPVAFVCSHPGRRISLTRLSLSSPPRRYQIATSCYHREGVKKDYHVYKISPNFAAKIQKELAETGEGGFIMESHTNLSSQATISLSRADVELFVHSMEIIAFGGVLFIGIAAAIFFIVMVFQDIKEGNRMKAYQMNMADKSEVDAAAARFFSRFFKEV